MFKKSIILIYGLFLFSLLLLNENCFAGDPKLVNTLNNAFQKVESYIIKLSTPAAGVAVGTGVLMKKFSFR